jgi:periplasmic protein TonB
MSGAYVRAAGAALALLLSLLPVRLAAEGRPSLNAYFQTTLKDEAYQKKTFDRVAKAWVSPPAKTFPKVGSKTVVQAVIAKDGKLASASVSMESGSEEWDAAALAAVRKAAPFDPFPAGFAFPSLEVHFHVSVVK